MLFWKLLRDWHWDWSLGPDMMDDLVMFSHSYFSGTLQVTYIFVAYLALITG